MVNICYDMYQVKVGCSLLNDKRFFSSGKAEAIARRISESTSLLTESFATLYKSM
jgi:hypothetical protein